jgi:hypothetical protein
MGEEHMIDRLILSAVLGTVGWGGVFPNQAKPPTSSELRQRGKDQSMSAVCYKKKKTPTVKEMCARWEKHQ